MNCFQKLLISQRVKYFLFQSLKVDKYEADIAKYKEFVIELEYSKSQTDELKKENVTLNDTQCSLQNQLTTANKRVDTLLDEVVKNQMMMDEINTVSEITRTGIYVRSVSEFLTKLHGQTSFPQKVIASTQRISFD